MSGHVEHAIDRSKSMFESIDILSRLVTTFRKLAFDSKISSRLPESSLIIKLASVGSDQSAVRPKSCTNLLDELSANSPSTVRLEGVLKAFKDCKIPSTCYMPLNM